jgi:microcystin degradation protein MlrC
VVVSEKPGWAHDPGLYRCVGLEPRRARGVVVKSPASFKELYEPFAERIVFADTPGVATHNLKLLPYRRAPRPLFPLEEGFEWRPEP